jgi:hypothetical protein
MSGVLLNVSYENKRWNRLALDESNKDSWACNTEVYIALSDERANHPEAAQAEAAKAKTTTAQEECR